MHKTISLQTRVEVTTIATLVRELEARGVRVHSKSEAIWHAITVVAKAYCAKREVEPFATVREAIDYMESMGLPLGTNSETLHRLFQAEADEALSLEGGLFEPKVTKPTVATTELNERKSFLHMTPEERKEMAKRIAENLHKEGDRT